jgi:hypothetical protein
MVSASARPSSERAESKAGPLPVPGVWPLGFLGVLYCAWHISNMPTWPSLFSGDLSLFADQSLEGTFVGRLQNPRHALFLMWFNATLHICCNASLPANVYVLSTPHITSPSSLLHSAASSPYAPGGDTLFERLYSSIVLHNPLDWSEDPLHRPAMITSGGVRGLYYASPSGPGGGNARGNATAEDGDHDRDTPLLSIPPEAHITRAVALKSLYGGALAYLTPTGSPSHSSHSSAEVEVGKQFAVYPPPLVPTIVGRITAAATSAKISVTSSKLNRALVLANLTPMLAELADDVILGLFLARERYHGANSDFAPWIGTLPTGLNQKSDPYQKSDHLAVVKRKVDRLVGRSDRLAGRSSDARIPISRLNSAKKEPEGELTCGWRANPERLSQVDIDGWREEAPLVREYAKNMATMLAKDFEWLITAPMPNKLGAADESNDGDGDGGFVDDWFKDWFTSKKDREKSMYGKHQKRRATNAYRENEGQKYKVADVKFSGSSSGSTKIVELIDWGMCMVTSRAVSATMTTHVHDAYYPKAAAAIDDVDASGEEIFMKQVEELIENEYRFIDGRAIDIREKREAVKREAAEKNKREGQSGSKADVRGFVQGPVKIVPLLDFINHGGTESIVEESDQKKKDYGSMKVSLDPFVKAAGRGEITVDYNIEAFSGLDWYLSQGFVPAERTGRWIKGKDVMKNQERHAKPDPLEQSRKEREASEKWRKDRSKK